MKYETVFIYIAVLMAVPMVAAVDISMEPGDDHPVNCGETNETYDMHCSDCTENNETCPACPSCNVTECEDCGVCSIRGKELQPGELFEYEEGTCDVEVYCGYEETAKQVEKNYTFRMKLNKHDGDDIYLGIEVVDFLNTITDSETYDWSRDSIVAITEEFDFTCPTKVIFDSVNADTCAGYFEDYYTDKDPMSMMLAKDMAIYRDRFLACQDNKSEIVWQIAHYEGLYRTCDNLKQNAITDMKTMNETYYDMKVSFTGAVNSARRGFVPDWMMWVAILGWLCFIMTVVLLIFGGEW